MATAPVRLDPSTWRQALGARLVTPEEAVSHVKSGDRVTMSISTMTPFTLCAALAGRLMEIEDVVVNHSAAVFDWHLPGLGERFKLQSFYVSPFDRDIYSSGAADFSPIQYYRAGHLPPGLENFNVFMVSVAPPDERGMCNFGDAQIMSKLLARSANLVIAEIDPAFIRVHGDNALHISEIDWFVERTIGLPDFPIPPVPEEEARAIDTVCSMIARELIPDRATIQIGVGSMSGAIMPYLKNHHELGMQTEIIPLHTAPLVRDGVITGAHKKLFPGQVVGSGFAPLTPRDQLEYVNDNPKYALNDFNTTDDIRLIAQEEGLISVNNAMSVDVTGHVNGESIGPMMYTGTGGQTAFVVGACLAGGKTVIVTPSSSIVKGQRVSRILPALATGAVATCPRSFVHHVVTEYGIATLKGKTLRERIGEMTAIAHPDFRSELRAQARRLYKI